MLKDKLIAFNFIIGKEAVISELFSLFANTARAWLFNWSFWNWDVCIGIH